MTPQEVAQQFVTAINAHDVGCLATLMTSDHHFIDSLGAVVEGRDSMRDGWKSYFAMVSDYHLEISRCFSSETAKDETMLAGIASGSYWSDGLKQPNSGWSTPVALRALVRDGQIAEWQVYADNEPIRQQLRAV
jgi:SnoaL-like domain